MNLGGEIGEITWHRIIEAEGPEFDIGFLLPDATPDAVAPHRDWMEPRFLEPGTGRLVMAIQSYVLRTRHHNILVDSCVGNDKVIDIELLNDNYEELLWPLDELLFSDLPVHTCKRTGMAGTES